MDHPWPPLRPLEELEQPPPFPVTALPKPLKDYALALAESYQVPVDLPACLMISACAAAVSKSHIVQLKPDWHEPLNLYVVISMPPASRKSPIFKAIMQPIEDFERNLKREILPRITQRDEEIELYREQIKQALRVAAKAEPDDQIQLMQEIKELKAKEPKSLRAPRLIVDDVTPERLVGLLCENGGRIAILSAEGGIFDIMGGRYHNKQPVIDAYLKGHSGDTIRTDRIGREAEYIEAPALTLGLTVQPEKLREVLSHSTFRGRGLTARFLYSQPPSLLGKRAIDTQPVLPLIRIAYDNMLKRLFRLTTPMDIALPINPAILGLSGEATKLFRDYCRVIENKLGESQSNLFTDWLGKLPGAVGRISAIFHCITHPDHPASCSIEHYHLFAAIEIGEYLEEHARHVFNIPESDPLTLNAKRTVKWIHKYNLARFQAREAFKALKSQQLPTMDNFWPILNLLRERNYIRPLPQPERLGPGQKPSPAFKVHPELSPQNRQNLQN